MKCSYKTGAILLTLSLAISSSYATHLRVGNLTGKSANRGTFFSNGKKMSTSFNQRAARIEELHHSYGTASFKETNTGALEYQEFHSAPLIDPALYKQNANGPFPIVQVSLSGAKDWFEFPASVLDKMTDSARKKSSSKSHFAVRKDKQGLVVELTETILDTQILSSQSFLIDSKLIYSDVRQTGPDRFVLAVVVEKEGADALEGFLYNLRYEAGTQNFDISPYRIPGSTKSIPKKAFGLDAPQVKPTLKGGAIGKDIS